MSRDRLKYAACQSCGYQDGSREHAVAQVATDCALDAWPNALPIVVEAESYSGSGDTFSRRLRKIREREEKELRRKTMTRTIAVINDNPEAYGFGPIALWFLGILISGVVKAVVAWLMEQRYTGQDDSIQSVISARAE